MVILFGKFVEHLGGGVSPEETDHCGQALRWPSSDTLPVCFCFLTADVMRQAAAGSCPYGFPAMVDCPPSWTVSQDRPSSPKWLPASHLITAMGKSIQIKGGSERSPTHKIVPLKRLVSSGGSLTGITQSFNIFLVLKKKKKLLLKDERFPNLVVLLSTSIFKNVRNLPVVHKTGGGRGPRIMCHWHYLFVLEKRLICSLEDE